MSVDNMENLDEETRKKIEKLLKVTREKDGNESYASAQIDKGLIYYNLNQRKQSYESFNNINKSDSLTRYMMAQFGMGGMLAGDSKFNEALKVWSNIKGLGDSLETAGLKFRVGVALLEDSFSEYDEAKQYFIEAIEYYPYESYCYQKICNLLSDSRLKVAGKKSLQLLNKTLEIVEILKLDFEPDSSDNKSPERKLAHYTNTSITNLLLEKNEDGSLPSFFRLNTINNVNDPSEGHLLVNYLKGIRENSFYAPDFDKDLHAFISCFTFNHDSLNQFRLYGKEADKEASGVSLVFKKEFFQLDNSLGGLSFLSFESNIQSANRDISTLVINKHSSMKESLSSKTRVSKQPVMRCVYIDPTSSYIQLAQRNRITFFREFGNETVVVQNREKSKAEYEWEEYKKYIDEKTVAFSDAFRTLKSTYESIIKEKKAIANDDLESSNKIDILINEILLPLKYLIKHSAFQEEQECRMVYVTSINAPEVNIAHKKLLFVEYEAEVKETLNKVYIAPAATEYQLYLAWLLRNTDVKIELSNNPYRQI
ncbi:DUF2971 domain-containing protein [Psychrobacter cryohalolentis]|uniref:UDP-n-acetylglucosamine-peptide-n-acetylglucosaminyltransferase n=1 Tax=Psychrobacter cryohalolentis (strain ATCC BAA-1226 / DSM 17306 / VKM B-2378 / K5) TaxID=335284 RepID=Q1QDW7_PSYCK|nr:DUF2971 domain-containing protein [Psychrobacter cryohalolentis]ABE74136.1 UDP-n-acetylglucosamine-peptide-n-acetylglucosaminyltransferase [Psychrobacter cryohalolentis K5]ASE26771.1 DUF2971 domain-containing protein [Psychrobacter cryohalolentis]